MKKLSWIFKGLVLSLSAGALHAQEVQGFKAGATEIAHFLLPQPGGVTIEYFISKPNKPAPLVVFIQGSGCIPVFTGLGTPQRASTVFSYITQAREGKYAVIVVNKPFVPAARVEGDGAATNCPDQFNQYFTLENWVRDLGIAFDHAQHLPWVTHDSALVIGVSEGGTVASALAVKDSRITNVALLGATGPTQFYDFVVSAYKSSDNDDEVKKRLDELEATRQRIAASPDSARDFAWGHPYKRWSSFFKTSSTNNLMKSRARVYLASGMQDVNVPILSTESMAAELMTAGRDVTFRRLPHAGHSLLAPGAQYPELESEYKRIMTWFGKE